MLNVCAHNGASELEHYDILRLCKELRKPTTTLHTIDISLSILDIKTLADALKHNKSVRILRLSHMVIDDLAVIALANMLKENATLSDISLRWTHIGPCGANVLANALQKNKTIRTVKLNGNDIGSDGARAFAKLVERNTNLQSLYLSYNSIGDDGVLALVDALKRNHTLVTLDLVGVRVASREQLALYSALRQNTTLTSFFFSNNRNRQLKWSIIDARVQSVFSGLYAAFGGDVYTFLLIVDCLPHIVLLDRARKVALLQMFCKNQCFTVYL